MASIYLRGKTYWVLYYEHGKKVQKSLKTKDKKIARFKKNEIENRLDLGESPLPNLSAPIKNVLDEYLSYCEKRVNKTTLKDYRLYLKEYVRHSKVLKLSQISQTNVSKYLDSKKISNNTANHIITYIKSFVNFGVERNYISQSPIENLKKFKVEKKPPRFLSKSEIKEILEESGELRPIVCTAIYTGMRKSELFRLRWEDVDIKKGTITVVKSKSNKFRVIPIHTKLKPVFKNKSSGLCFDTFNIRRSFDKLCKGKNIGWHTFRHTFASHLVMNGVDIATVSKLLGHASISTTQIYSHLSDSHIKESIKKLEF